MKCFSHPDQFSVGICKSCQKGVCTSCAVDLGKGLACRGTCEEDVRLLVHLIEANMRISPISTKAMLGHGTTLLWTAAMSIVMGSLFAAWSVRFDPPVHTLTAIGLMLVLWGIVQAFQAFRVRSAGRDSTPPARP
jgi:hypothetical protein